jgi:hypothetical protein
MDGFEKINIVKYTFELDNGKPLELEYYLQNNSLKKKWVREVGTHLKKSDAYLNLKLSNKNYLHLKELQEKINSIVEEINAAYEYKMLVPLTGTTDICRTTLNNLHEKFEEYGEYGAGDGEGPWYRNQNVHNLWLDLNEWIHVTETALDSGEDDYPNYSALVTVYPPYPGKDLEEVDKLFLTAEYAWGHLYLGYNTLGKDYLHVWLDEDVRVITNNQVKVQNKYSSEAWLCFQEPSFFLNEAESNFYNWYKNLDKEVRDMIPTDNLSKLAFGRYYLGCISINRDLTKFHPIERDWFTDKNLQKRWNNEVFSKVKSVTKIDFYE